MTWNAQAGTALDGSLASIDGPADTSRVLPLEDLTLTSPRISERFGKVHWCMSHVLTEYVNPALGGALNSLYINLFDAPSHEDIGSRVVHSATLGRVAHHGTDARPAGCAAGNHRDPEGIPAFQQLINPPILPFKTHTHATAGSSRRVAAREQRAMLPNRREFIRTSPTPLIAGQQRRSFGTGLSNTCDSWRRDQPSMIGSNGKMRQMP